MKPLITLLCLSLALPIYATDDHRHKHKPAVVVHEHEHNHALAGALIGAGITYWIMRRRAKKAAPVQSVCETRIERAELACSK